MKSITIRSFKKPRRNPLVVAVRQRQAGPHQDGRYKEARKLADREMRVSMNHHMYRQEGSSDE